MYLLTRYTSIYIIHLWKVYVHSADTYTLYTSAQKVYLNPADTYSPVLNALTKLFTRWCIWIFAWAARLKRILWHPPLVDSFLTICFHLMAYLQDGWIYRCHKSSLSLQKTVCFLIWPISNREEIIYIIFTYLSIINYL